MPMTPLFIAESFSTLKMGMFEKTRAQCVEIWLKKEGFKIEKKKSKFSSTFSIFRSANKKHRKLAKFQECSEFFSTWSVINPLFSVWVNFYTREHKKAPKSLNVAVGPQRFPQQQKPYLTCLMRAFVVQIERFLRLSELPCPGQRQPLQSKLCSHARGHASRDEQYLLRYCCWVQILTFSVCSSIPYGLLYVL